MCVALLIDDGVGIRGDAGSDHRSCCEVEILVGVKVRCIDEGVGVGGSATCDQRPREVVTHVGCVVMCRCVGAGAHHAFVDVVIVCDTIVIIGVNVGADGDRIGVVSMVVVVVVGGGRECFWFARSLGHFDSPAAYCVGVVVVVVVELSLDCYQ